MRTTIAYNGSFFNTNRMVKQYIRNAYYPVNLIEPRKLKSLRRSAANEGSPPQTQRRSPRPHH